jgi:ABC-type phosphate/phosphonate transport system permease subunit
MPPWPWLVLVAIVGLLVAIVFAFTLPGLIAEVVAAVALLALIIKGLLALARRSPAHRDF